MGRTLEILERLVGFSTVSSHSNHHLIEYVQDLLQAASFDITRIPSPCGTKAGLFARIGRGDGGVVLSAHTDVVPVEGQSWTRPPFELTRDKTRVFGRGTTDMKGFLASALAMGERAAKENLSAPLCFSISYDEEIGCVGIRQMMPVLAPLLGQPRAVIVGEPTSMQVATGHKGKASLKVTCHGQSGHSALAPYFVNAIHLAAGFVTEMQNLQNDLAQGPRDDAYDIPYSTVHVGRIEGGRSLNIVPDCAKIDMEFRHLVSSPATVIRAKIDAAAQTVIDASTTTSGITIDEVNSYPGLETALDAPVVGWAKTLIRGANTTKVAFGTEAGFFSDLGLPTVVIGPGDMASDGHKPDESLGLDELSECDAFLDRVLDDLRQTT